VSLTQTEHDFATIKKATLRHPCFSTLHMPLAAHAERFQSIGTTAVYFSPKGGATVAAVAEIAAAKSETLLQAFQAIQQQNHIE